MQRRIVATGQLEGHHPMPEGPRMASCQSPHPARRGRSARFWPQSVRFLPRTKDLDVGGIAFHGMGEAVRMRSAFGLIDQSEFDDQACPINFLEFGLHGHAYRSEEHTSE